MSFFVCLRLYSEDRKYTMIYADNNNNNLRVSNIRDKLMKFVAPSHVGANLRLLEEPDI